ncbi:MAG TPA: glycosyl hydrolase family 18 protein [Gemmatimonadaceae bacterium]
MRSSSRRFVRHPSALSLTLCIVVGACAAWSLSAAARLRVWGFTVPWDAKSSASARDHATQLSAVISGWIQLDSVTGKPFAEFRDTLARHTPPGMRLMAIVTNAVGGRFHPAVVRQLAADPTALASAASEVARRLTSGGYRGLVIDLEGFAPADRDAIVVVVRAIADSARRHAVTPIALAIPAVDTVTFPARSFVPSVDYVLVMLYDQHWMSSAPGPLAAPDWVRAATARRVAEVGAAHVVAALPLYGYRWPTTGPAAALTFPDAQRDAAAAGVQLQRDTATSTLRATSAGAWDLWISDAGLITRLVHEVRGEGVNTIALWRLGQEDPAVWPALARIR